MQAFRIILSIIFALSATSLYAQETEIAKSDSVAKIEGELYTIHTVSAKQTLFSIAKTYEVNLSRIAFDNPGVLDGLKLGQQLKILKSAQGETRSNSSEGQALELDGDYVLYTVPKKQTLYSISKEYNTTLSAILDANPELADGLKVGMTIRVPVPKLLEEKHQGKIEMVGLPDIVKNQVEETLDPGHEGNPARIALMLPLYLDDNDTIEARRLSEEPESVYDRSEIALAFYEGFLLALDSLYEMGVKPEVSVFDTENRAGKVRKLMKQEKFKEFDLVIGPLYGKLFAEVAEFAYQNCIPIVTPTLKGKSVAEANDFVLKIIPSQKSMVFSMGKYLALSDSTQNIILHYGSEPEMDFLTSFRNGVSSAKNYNAPFQQINIYQTGTDSLRRILSNSKRNNLVFLSTNEVRLASLLRNMSNWLEENYIVGFVPNEWNSFKNIEMDYFDKFRIHAPVPFFIDYERLDVQNFVMDFRARFKGEPSTFSFRGFDIAMHLGKNLSGIQEFGLEYLESVEYVGLQSNFSWKRVPNGGLENTASYLVDYTGLELKIATD